MQPEGWRTMSSLAIVQDMMALTGRYYARLRELVLQVPEDRLGARVGDSGLTVTETVRHVCEADHGLVSLIAGTPRKVEAIVESKAGLLSGLERSEAMMMQFLEGLDPELLEARREVPTWWGQGEPRSGRLILMHLLAHKYYHCGQLPSILHVLATETE